MCQKSQNNTKERTKQKSKAEEHVRTKVSNSKRGVKQLKQIWKNCRKLQNAKTEVLASDDDLPGNGAKNLLAQIASLQPATNLKLYKH